MNSVDSTRCTHSPSGCLPSLPSQVVMANTREKVKERDGEDLPSRVDKEFVWVKEKADYWKVENGIRMSSDGADRNQSSEE